MSEEQKTEETKTVDVGVAFDDLADRVMARIEPEGTLITDAEPEDAPLADPNEPIEPLGKPMTEEDAEPEATPDDTDDLPDVVDVSEDVEFPRHLRNRAIDHGLDPDDFRTVEALQRMLNKVAPAETEAEPEPVQLEVNFETYALDTSTFEDEEMVGVIDQVNEHYKAQFDAFAEKANAEIEALKSQLGNLNAEASTLEFDGLVNGLGKGYEKLFGSGPTSELDRDGLIYGNRAVLRDEMDALAAGYEARNRRVPEGPELFKRALNAVFGDDIQKIQKEAAVAKVARNTKQIVGRGKATKTPEAATPEERAAMRVAEMQGIPYTPVRKGL